MDHQSKQGQGQGHGKRKKSDEASASNGGNGTSGFPTELVEKAEAAAAAEKQSVDKGIEAWKKIVASAPKEWAPRRELARVYKKAERWNNFIETMKEAIEKGSWQSPEDKIPVLEEMIEVYRDRLKLDVMVVNAFNQILSIQPDNFEAADALAAQFETMKRWPDLIALLRKKAQVVEAPEDKIALHLRVANLFLEKFSNQAEAIKAYETILELDPDNSEALAFVKQMYEKRRDWDKLIAVNQREIDKLRDPEERKVRRHRGREARVREDEEGVGIDRPLAEGAGGRRRKPRGAGRAGETLRAREGVERAGRWCWSGRWPRPATSRGSRRSTSSWASCSPRRCRTRRRRRPRGRRCWRWSRRIAAPRTRSRSFTCSRRTGTRWKRSTPRRTSGTSWCASWSARPRAKTTAAASVCGTRSASCIAIV